MAPPPASSASSVAPAKAQVQAKAQTGAALKGSSGVASYGAGCGNSYYSWASVAYAVAGVTRGVGGVAATSKLTAGGSAEANVTHTQKPPRSAKLAARGNCYYVSF